MNLSKEKAALWTKTKQAHCGRNLVQALATMGREQDAKHRTAENSLRP